MSEIDYFYELNKVADMLEKMRKDEDKEKSHDLKKSIVVLRSAAFKLLPKPEPIIQSHDVVKDFEVCGNGKDFHIVKKYY